MMFTEICKNLFHKANPIFLPEFATSVLRTLILDISVIIFPTDCCYAVTTWKILSVPRDHFLERVTGGSDTFRTHFKVSVRSRSQFFHLFTLGL